MLYFYFLSPFQLNWMFRMESRACVYTLLHPNKWAHIACTFNCLYELYFIGFAHSSSRSTSYYSKNDLIKFTWFLATERLNVEWNTDIFTLSLFRIVMQTPLAPQQYVICVIYKIIVSYIHTWLWYEPLSFCHNIHENLKKKN